MKGDSETKKNSVVVSIPMLPPDNLSKIRYRLSEEEFSSETSFPGIALIENFVDLSKETKLITVRTDDDNNRTAECYSLFREELFLLSQRKEIKLDISEEIIVPHNESTEKENLILRALFENFLEKSDVFLDLTYGTKLTAIEMFSSLFYAEIAKNCNIKKVVYGKFSFNESGIGELFDATKLYNKIRLLGTAQFMEKEIFSDFVENNLI